MWKRKAAVATAGISWGAAASQAMPGLPYWMSQPGMVFILSVAISSTFYVSLRCHQRPIAQAYELGFEMGRRDAIRDANRRSLSPIRREPHSLSALTAAARRERERAR